MPKTKRKAPVTLAPVSTRSEAERYIRLATHAGARISEGPTPERVLRAAGAVEAGMVETVVDPHQREAVTVAQGRVRMRDDVWERVKASAALSADPDERRVLGEAGDRFALDHGLAFGSPVRAIDYGREGSRTGDASWHLSDYQVAARRRHTTAVAALDATTRKARVAVAEIVLYGREPSDVGRQISPTCQNAVQARTAAVENLYTGLCALAKHYGLTSVTR